MPIKISLLFSLFLVMAYACSITTLPCKSHSDCGASQRCSLETKQCTPLCQTQKDCQPEHRCEPSLQYCVKSCQSAQDCTESQRCSPKRTCKAIQCPKDRSPKQGLCPCESQPDCPESTYCDPNQNACRWLCTPGGKGPEIDRCDCPPNWEWVQNECRATCFEGFQRREDGICHPTLALLDVNSVFCMFSAS